MKWNHSKNNMITGELHYLPGTLVYLNLKKYSLISGETPFSGIFSGKLTKMGDFCSKSPIAMIVGLDCLENHYRVLVSEKLYWISVDGVISAGRTTTANTHATTSTREHSIEHLSRSFH